MITHVVGKTRVGKTAFLVADMTQYMNRSISDLELYQRCCEEVLSINANGDFGFALPAQSPVYSNFKTCFQVGYNQYVGSYYMDGFHMGVENEFVDTLPVLPCSRIYLSEAQRYYDSNHTGGIPEWVSRFFEEHGHFDLDILLDSQRPILVHKNIRELIHRFVYVENMHNFTDKMGNIVASRWTYKEFDDWKYVESFIDNGDTRHCETKTLDYLGNVFEHYESKCYRAQFIPVRRQFSMQQHMYGARDDDELLAMKFRYSQTAPENYWPNEIKRDKQGNVIRRSCA